MRAMWLGFAAAIVIAVVSGVLVNNAGDSSAERFSTESTRL